MKSALTRNLCILLLFISMIQSQSLPAQDRAHFGKHVFRGMVKDGLPYRLFQPVTEPGKTYPLVVFLHGSGERGSDNEKQLSNGVFNFVLPENQKNNPCFVLVPQCPDGLRWVKVSWTVKSVQQPDTISAPLQDVMDLIATLVQELPADTNRLYLCGLSMGGFGTWDLITRYPDVFAAAVPVCGGGDCSRASRIKDLPVWAFHGAKDDVVDPVLSRDMVAAIRKAGGLPGYTEYPHLNHGSWDAAFSDSEMLRWLFEQRKR